MAMAALVHAQTFEEMQETVQMFKVHISENDVKGLKKSQQDYQRERQLYYDRLLTTPNEQIEKIQKDYGALIKTEEFKLLSKGI